MSIKVTPVILTVCTANICRSASAAHVLRETLAATASTAHLEVASAGTHALEGTPGCDLSLAMVGADSAGHSSRRITEEMIRGADLILCASKDHRGAVAQLVPSARSRTFTLRQAARIAGFLVAEDVLGAAADKAAGTPREFPEGDHRLQVAPLPPVGAARMRWLVEEMDAARGLAPGVDSSLVVTRVSPQAAGASAAGILGDPDDVVDPHVVGYERHGQVVEQIRESVALVCEALIASHE